MGTGFAMTISNFVLFLSAVIVTKCHSALREANSVRFCEIKVFQNICLYLSFGLPNIFILLIPQIFNEIMVLVAGFFGVKHQACLILLFNFNMIMQ